MATAADSGENRDQAQGQRREEPKQGWTTAEKTTFVVSIVVVLALAAIAVIEHFSQPAGELPVIDVTIAVDEAERQDEAFVIPFSISNAGPIGASDVTVRFEVTAGESGELVDEITVAIPNLPVQGIEEGLLMISADPASHQITGRVESLLVP